MEKIETTTMMTTLLPKRHIRAKGWVQVCERETKKTNSVIRKADGVDECVP